MALQDPDKPRQSGRVRMPSVDAGMNKTMPMPTKSPRGQKSRDRTDEDALRPGQKSPDQLRKEEILTRARKRFDRCVSVESDNRKAGVDDLKHKSGEGQWPADVVSQRNFDQRPALTINKIPTFVNQVVNDERMNRPAININPVGDRSDVEVAKMYRGLIRSIERQSQADIAYDTGFESAVSIGWGEWRVCVEYESPDSFNRVLTIKRIRNPFTVYRDPAHKEPEGSDAKYCFVTELIPRKEFEEEWPDADPMPWTQGGFGEDFKNWVTEHEIRIAEYFEFSYEKRKLVMLANGHTGWEDELSDEGKKIEVVDEDVRDWPTLKWFKLTATDILEEQDWPGLWIPIVKTIGNEIDIEGKVRLSGLIRNMKTPQMLYNYHRATSLDTPIPTPGGWTTMGQIGIGDRVFGEDGGVYTVTGQSPVFINRPCYRILFDDGSHIDTDAEHRWKVETRRITSTMAADWTDRIVDTASLRAGKDFIWSAKPLELPEQKLPVHPYVLGAWLGDGSSIGGDISPGYDDTEEMREIITAFGYQVSPVRKHAGRAGTFGVYGLLPRLRGSGVLGNKHIPPAYLRASVEQRRLLLQGLMDTDGCVKKDGRQRTFVTTNDRLRVGIEELLVSLGIKSTHHVRPAVRMRLSGGYESDCLEAYYVSFSAYQADEVCRLSRHRAKERVDGSAHMRRTKRHKIVSVTPISSVPVKCIMVDNPTHLFLAGPSMIPTHNTLSVELSSMQPKAPWVMAEGQDEGYEAEWRNSNRQNLTVLHYVPKDIEGRPAPPPQRQPFQGAPQAVLAETQAAAQDFMAVTGLRFDATQQERVYDESGRALRELRERGDIGSFHYVDNFARSLRHTGEILVDLIPKIYDTRRVLTILREDDSEQQVMLDPHAAQPISSGKHPITNKKLKIFNPTYGKYGVTVTIGPSYATKRIEAAESMMDFVRAVGPIAPQMVANILDLIAKNLDWQDADQVTARLAKMLPANLLAPSLEDMSPQVQALLQSLQQQVQALNNEKLQLTAALTNQNADRAITQDKIEKDFEAKLLTVVANFETKMAAVQQKADQAAMDKIASPLAELAEGVRTLHAALAAPPSYQSDVAAVAPVETPPAEPIVTA